MDHLFGEKGISSNFVSWRVKSIAVSDEEAKGENVVCFYRKARPKKLCSALLQEKPVVRNGYGTHRCTRSNRVNLTFEISNTRNLPFSLLWKYGNRIKMRTKFRNCQKYTHMYIYPIFNRIEILFPRR